MGKKGFWKISKPEIIFEAQPHFYNPSINDWMFLIKHLWALSLENRWKIGHPQFPYEILNEFFWPHSTRIHNRFHVEMLVLTSNYWKISIVLSWPKNQNSSGGETSDITDNFNWILTQNICFSSPQKNNPEKFHPPYASRGKLMPIDWP